MAHVPEALILEIEEEEDVAESIEEVTRLLEEKGGRWILKASTGNAGEDLVVFDSVEEVKGLLAERGTGNVWVVQRYIDRPLLLRGRKFHFRVHVLVVGSLQVYVHRDLIGLLSSVAYESAAASDAWAHLTNHCIQTEHPDYNEADSIVFLDELAKVLEEGGCSSGEAAARVSQLWLDVLHVVRGIFEAFQKAPPVAWFPFDNCFEVLGVDVMLDEEWKLWLLEVNSGADFETFGRRNAARCEAFLGDTLAVAVEPHLDGAAAAGG